jgi:hypothetical protein
VLGRRATSWLAEPLATGTPAATAGAWRVHAAGESLVLKLLHCAAGNPRWPAQPKPTDPYYWRREAEAYASGLLARLAPPLRAPDCHACIDRDDGTAALWLEDVRLPPAAAWDLDRYRTIAFHLGRAQGELAQDPPREEWLSRRWLRAYLELRAADIARHGSGRTYELWQQREPVLERIEAAPQTLAHLDFYPENFFGDEHETVIIDWAYCGLAAVGEDAGNVVPDSLLDVFVPAEDADELERLVWRGYVDGLRAAGWAGEEDEVRFVYAATAGVKFAWIAAYIEMGHERAHEWRPVVPFLDRMAEEALELASAA